MWLTIAKLILRNRFALLLSLFFLTLFMGYEAARVQLSYEFAKVLPLDDPDYLEYLEFTGKFGEDGNVLVIGIEDPNIFRLDHYRDWYDLSASVRAVKGIREVVSIASLYDIVRNDSLQRLEFRPLVAAKPTTQAAVDSIKEKIQELRFYEGFIFNSGSKSTVMAVTFEKGKLNSKSRIEVVNAIKAKAFAFGKKHGVEIHLSGLPYIRTEISKKVATELIIFLLLGFVVTGIILLLFFRSFNVVFFSLLVVVIGVIWSLASITLFGYKITILTGLIPPVIIVIGIPNSILLLNKYQQEFRLHGNRIKALTTTITKVGFTTFLANVTTAIGFGVFYFTNSELLMQFGLIAALNVMLTYAISIILIPVIFSLLPAPSSRHTAHLKARVLTSFLEKVDYWVHNYRTRIYLLVFVLVITSLIGMRKIRAIGYVVDDLPKNDPIYVDMKFFERTVKGVLPLEIMVDTRKSGGVLEPATLYKINRLQKVLMSYDEFSKPLSVAEAVKFSYQAFREGGKYYQLPGAMELSRLAHYAEAGSGSANSYRALVDSNRQVARISVQMADVGSIRMKEIMAELQPRVDSIFKPSAYKVSITGNSLLFLKGNDYLLANLKESVLLAILLIAVIMFMLFMSFRMISISILPSLIPLLITAGIMGYTGIPLKPSSILIFSIAFGIASDGTIYFLTRYRQELNKGAGISGAVSATIHETGLSMVYVALILFFGFSIFTASDFGGTVALGILVSFTLLVAMCSNLILLPCLLVSLEKRMTTPAFLSEPLLQVFDEKDDIEPEELELKKTDTKNTPL
jgi:uncharacterized protein